MRLESGMVFASDTRTNAGMDNVATFSKMHVWERLDDRVIVLLTAGNLAFTQSIISLLNERIRTDRGSKTLSLMSAETMFQAALAVGDAIRSMRDNEKGVAKGNAGLVNGTFILGGQIRGESQRLFHIYREGNFIEATSDTPYFQIGEHKYGKPILDRVATIDMTPGAAAKLLLLSFDSTMRSNLSVGAPIDLLLYRKDSFSVEDRRRLHENDPRYQSIAQSWSRALKEAFCKVDDL
jgi:putative proteasome-type protease